jgi:hypothetical protein
MLWVQKFGTHLHLQLTKNGKMRGSYEILHDCDIAVKVENGVATTTKNRFKEKGMEFSVLNSSEKSVRKIIDERSNEI